MAVPAQMLEAAQWAADQFGGGIARRNAFVAWWACEDGYKWPTNSRNNPGNMRPGGTYRGVVGVTPRVGPLGGFFVFDTPADGVAAMVQAIETSAHYPGIRAALAGGNAQAIAKAVGASPWGTNSPCMLSALKSIPSTPTPTGTGWQTVNRQAGVPSAGGAPVAAAPAPQGKVVSLVNARTTAACNGPVTILEPANRLETVVIPIPGDLIPGIATGCTQCPAGWTLAISQPGPLRNLPIIGGLIAGGWVDPSTLPPGTPNSCVAPGTQPGTPFDAAQAAGAAGAAAAAAAAAVSAWVGPFVQDLGGLAAHLGEGLVIALLLIVGLYVLATAEE